MPDESFCSCCGMPSSIYQTKGHSQECIWYEDEMYRLAAEWGNSKEEANWEQRYDMIVGFLLTETTTLKKSLDKERL